MERIQVPLSHGTLLLMSGATQDDWQVGPTNPRRGSLGDEDEVLTKSADSNGFILSQRQHADTEYVSFSCDFLYLVVSPEANQVHH